MSGLSNGGLNRARSNKKDELYTRMEDIEDEISRYSLKQFKDKTVYCNCDDPTWSNFFKFFTKWGKRLELKKVHFTNYSNKGREFVQLDMFDLESVQETRKDDKEGKAHHWIYTPKTGKIEKFLLDGNGDFRSKECLKILDDSDIIITNPPFSLLTEFLNLIIERDKKYLIIGDENEIASRQFWHYYTKNKIWTGYTHPKEFYNQEGGIHKLGFACWFTNLDVSTRNQPLVLHDIDPCIYKKYDNYDAIEVNKSKNIPDNYFGNMGVSIFFVEKLCPNQFEIVDYTPAFGEVPKINGKKTYRRIIIRRKK